MLGHSIQVLTNNCSSAPSAPMAKSTAWFYYNAQKQHIEAKKHYQNIMLPERYFYKFSFSGINLHTPPHTPWLMLLNERRVLYYSSCFACRLKYASTDIASLTTSFPVILPTTRVVCPLCTQGPGMEVCFFGVRTVKPWLKWASDADLLPAALTRKVLLVVSGSESCAAPKPGGTPTAHRMSFDCDSLVHLSASEVCVCVSVYYYVGTSAVMNTRAAGEVFR